MLDEEVEQSCLRQWLGQIGHLSKSSCRFKVWRDSVTALYIENPYNGKFAYYIGR